jgi:alpha-tubulin suppressor-like RCC1 family protein
MSAARAVSVALVVLAAGVPACKRKTPPVAEAAWLGPSHACARIKVAGDVRCWGANGEGELLLDLADPSTTQLVPAPSRVARDVRSLGLGRGFSCALEASGRVRCWGVNDEGQLGDGASAPSRVPREVAVGASALAVGARHTCMLAEGGALRCWGANGAREVSPVETEPRVRRPVHVKLPGPVTAFAVGDAHTCAATTEPRSLTCWGEAAKGRLGDHTDELTKNGVKQLTAGAAHTCALTDGARVYCWGANDVGQLGDGTRVESARPVLVARVDGATSVRAGRAHTCALLRSGTVACWGANDAHQLADGTTDPRAEPIPLHGIVSVREILLAGDGSCVLLGDGQLRCWGHNDRGQLGDGSTTPHDVPMPVRFSLGAPRVVASAGRY